MHPIYQLAYGALVYFSVKNAGGSDLVAALGSCAGFFLSWVAMSLSEIAVVLKDRR